MAWTKNWKTLLSLVAILATTGALYYTQIYQTSIYGDEQGMRTLQSFSLGESGEKPFYQTDRDRLLLQKFGEYSENMELQFLAGKYFQNYNALIKQGGFDAAGLRINQDQYKEIYQMVTDACEILETPLPRIYLVSNENAGIRVAHYEDPVLLIGAGMTEGFSPDELRYLIARQVGHIKTKHIFYKELLGLFKEAKNAILPGFLTTWLDSAVGLAFLEWYREAEVTADRAGLVVAGNIQIATQALMKWKLGISTQGEYAPLDPVAYAKQAGVIEEISKKSVGVLQSELYSDQPFMPYRIKNLLEFYQKNLNLFQ